MKTKILIILLLPTFLSAQEFTFRQEFDTIPVEINGWQPFAPWAGGFTNCKVKFADIDADNDYDLFIGGNGGGGPVSFLQNEGSQYEPLFHWIAVQYDSLRTLNSAGNSDPDFWDVDGDGDLDAIIGAGYVTFVENIGTPEVPDFASMRDTLYTVDSVVVAPRLALIDIDLDQDVDLVAGYSDHLVLYTNIGTPDSFAFQLTESNWLNINVGGWADPTFSDIDADNDLDLFVGNENGVIYFYRNDGDSANYEYTFITDSYNNIDVGENASPEFADIDGDGDYDLFVGRDQESNVSDETGDIWYFENIGTPDSAQWLFITTNYLSLDTGNKAKLNTTDIDVDNDNDIFIAIPGNTLGYYENTGSSSEASFIWITDNYQGISVNSGSHTFRDINADQDPDLFIGEALVPCPPYPGLYYFENIGTPQQANFVEITDDLIPSTYWVLIRPFLADIDADGDNDIFLCDGNGDFYFAENIGTPTHPSFSSPVINWQGIEFYSGTFFCFYDLDNDDDFDLFFFVGTDYDRHVVMYPNLGTPSTPSFSLQPDTIITNLNYIGYFDGIDINDIDDDGDGDFLLGTGWNGGILFFRNTTGDTSAVNPPLIQHPLHGIEMTFGPNPANPITWVSFNLPYPQKAELAVYNLLGQKVATLASGHQMPGQHTFFWNAAKQSSGTYFIRLETDLTEAVQTKRVVILR